MWLSDISVKRPVFATVMSLLLIAFGIISFDRLSLREYPNIDPPVISISTNYRGASAAVVENRITQLIEDRIAGVEGIKFINSQSSDGRSRISLEFEVGRDVNEAANDIRDRVSGLANNLPVEADPPEIQKVDSDEDVILWLGIESDRLTSMELTDYARRYLEDRFSTLDGVARVRIGGGLEYSMRIWVDRRQLAARGMTIVDIENALRSQNVELPAGSIESATRQFTARVERGFRTQKDFENLVIGRGNDGYLVKLSDVANVEQAPEESRTVYRGNRLPSIGIGVIKQSTANTLEVADAVKAEIERIADTLPIGMEIKMSYDSSVFVSNAIREVYSTLIIAILLVVLVIYLFLGDIKAVLVPAVAVPVSIIATTNVLYALGFSINMFTLLALVLAIGLVVDDGIVVLENIYRRIKEGQESSLVASYQGARQVGFAVIATTGVLAAVFLPIAFLQGDVGRLFREFSITIAAAVIFSSFVALTLSPVLCTKLFRKISEPSLITKKVGNLLDRAKSSYMSALQALIYRPKYFFIGLVAVIALGFVLVRMIPSEFAPREDRGAFFVMAQGPEGASFQYISQQMEIVEDVLMNYVDTGEVSRVLIRAPRGFGNVADFSNGMAIVIMEEWSKRRPADEVLAEVRGKLSKIPGVRAMPIMRQGLGGGIGKPVQFVIGGADYSELARWRDIVIAKAEENPGLHSIEHDYQETKPQIRIDIDRERAGDLGVSIANIGRTLESLLGSRIVTTYITAGEEYNVIVEGIRDQQSSPSDINNIFVRSENTGELVPLESLVTVREFADAGNLNRYNRMNAITISADLTENYALGDALDFLEDVVRTELPAGAVIDYKGASLDFKESSGAMYLTLGLSILVVFLVLSAQFESFVQPLVIMIAVPFAIIGAFIGLMLTGQSINIYTQIGFIMLVGLAAKNGILIVEFINQLRDEGTPFEEAILEGSALRLRPILMTVVTTAMGAVPLILSSGAGKETRLVIGVVLFFGVIFATGITIFLVPVLYRLLCQKTSSPEAIERQLESELSSSSTSTSIEVLS
ncbi:MAG: efflux RND transporter permease subunit [Oligoflexus sp.]